MVRALAGDSTMTSRRTGAAEVELRATEGPAFLAVGLARGQRVRVSVVGPPAVSPPRGVPRGGSAGGPGPHRRLRRGHRTSRWVGAAPGARRTGPPPPGG